MSDRTLIVLGSGPGIGVAAASTFATHGFTHIALVARNKDRLAQDEAAVSKVIQQHGRSCQVKTWLCDLSDLTQLKVTIKEIETFGAIEVVLFNAARVGGKPPIEESVTAIETDFRTTNLALYELAQWAIPLLKKSSASPSLFVTSTSQLWKEPHYDLVSLSMVKSAQRALVLSLHHHFGGDVHIALLSVGGVVSPDAQNLTPDNIAGKALELYEQPKSKWEREVEIPE